MYRSAGVKGSGLLAGVLVTVLWTTTAWAIDVVKVPQPPDFARYAYHYELLEQVLEKTVEEYGPYLQQPYTEPLTTVRVLREAIAGDLLNVLALDFGSDAANEGMIPVPYPIDKGLLGYRVALIADGSQERMGRVDNLEELRGLVVGRGAGWGDVRIYEHNGVPVVTAPDYDSLFLMLSRGRFDLFPRGITEAPQELTAFGDRYPNLRLDEHLLLKYPYGQVFYVSRSAPRLAERLARGLEKMLADGSLDALFDKHFAKTIADLRLTERVVIELENPFAPAWVPFDVPSLWFDPTQIPDQTPTDSAADPVN